MRTAARTRRKRGGSVDCASLTGAVTTTTCGGRGTANARCRLAIGPLDEAAQRTRDALQVGRFCTRPRAKLSRESAIRVAATPRTVGSRREAAAGYESPLGVERPRNRVAAVLGTRAVIAPAMKKAGTRHSKTCAARYEARFPRPPIKSEKRSVTRGPFRPPRPGSAGRCSVRARASNGAVERGVR